eukprot:UN00449
MVSSNLRSFVTFILPNELSKSPILKSCEKISPVKLKISGKKYDLSSKSQLKSLYCDFCISVFLEVMLLKLCIRIGTESAKFNSFITNRIFETRRIFHGCKIFFEINVMSNVKNRDFYFFRNFAFKIVIVVECSETFENCDF